MNNDFFYLGAGPLHSGLYAGFAKALADEGIRTTLVLNQPVDIRHLAQFLSQRRYIRDTYVEPIGQLYGGTVLGPLPFHYRAKLAYMLLLPTILAGSIWRGHRILVHARTVHVADAVLSIRRVVPRMLVISELEGDGESELRYTQGRIGGYSENGLRRRIALDRTATRRVLINSDAVFCVSRRLVMLLAKRHNLSASQVQKISVVPTYATREWFFFDGARRAAARERWGINAKYVVAYSGNLSTPWQLSQQTVRVFQQIKQCRQDAFLLVISPETDHSLIAAHLDQAGLGTTDYALRQVPYKDMPDALCAADLGVVLREDHEMNRVSSPGKIGEYLLCGLPVLTTAAVGDYPDRLSGRREVLVLKQVRSLSLLEEEVRQFARIDFTEEERSAFAGWAADRFSLQSVLPRVLDAYRRLLRNPQ